MFLSCYIIYIVIIYAKSSRMKQGKPVHLATEIGGPCCRTAT